MNGYFWVRFVVVVVIGNMQMYGFDYDYDYDSDNERTVTGGHPKFTNLDIFFGGWGGPCDNTDSGWTVCF